VQNDEDNYDNGDYEEDDFDDDEEENFKVSHFIILKLFKENSCRFRETA
jgi:hypothetical protein